MVQPRVYEHTIPIYASASAVEFCFTDLPTLHRWLNPALRCEPMGDTWSTDLGSRSRFVIQVPLLAPSLYSTVVEREPGLVVWQFEGFFQGTDRWECRPTDYGTELLNRFSFTVPNPVVAWGFDAIAARWTQADMAAQLKRLKQVAETQRNPC